MLGRLEYQKGNFDAALQVFYGIDIKSLSPRMIKAISDRTLQQISKSKRENGLLGLMSLHSVSLLLEAILLKAKSLQAMSRFKGMLMDRILYHNTFIHLNVILFCYIRSCKGVQGDFGHR